MALHVVNREQERPFFESYVKLSRGSSYLTRKEAALRPEDDYKDCFIQSDWEAWLARAALCIGACLG